MAILNLRVDPKQKPLAQNLIWLAHRFGWRKCWVLDDLDLQGENWSCLRCWKKAAGLLFFYKKHLDGWWFGFKMMCPSLDLVVLVCRLTILCDGWSHRSCGDSWTLANRSAELWCVLALQASTSAHIRGDLLFVVGHVGCLLEVPDERWPPFWHTCDEVLRLVDVKQVNEDVGRAEEVSDQGLWTSVKSFTNFLILVFCS